MAVPYSGASNLNQRKVTTMMDGLMNGSQMMFGMGLFGLLTVTVLALAGAALVKYLFFPREKNQRNG